MKQLRLAALFGLVLISCARTAAPASVVPTVEVRVPSSTPSPVPSVTPTATLAPAASATSTPLPTFTPTLAPTSTSVPPTPTPACVEKRGHIQVGTFFSTVIGQDQAYRVYLPPCYDFSPPYPVLYMLHGYPFDDSHWDEIGIDEAADAGIAAGTLPRFIIAMPAADNEGTYTHTSGGAGSFEAVLMNEFIPFIEANYRALGSAEGRAIGGMSRGGVWSLEIAFRNPDRFTAVGGHSVALNVNQAPPVYDPLFLAADPRIRSLRISLDVGQDDWVLPGMDDLHAALAAAGVVHDYHIFEGYHDDSYWSEHVAEYLAFYAAEW
jgi:enterochelin esterase-like enzyme